MASIFILHVPFFDNVGLGLDFEYWMESNGFLLALDGNLE